MASFPGAIYPVPSFGANMSDAKTHTTWRDEITDEVRAIELRVGTTSSGALATLEALASSGEQGADSAGPTSGTTALTVNTFTLGVPGAAGRVHGWGQMSFTKSVSTDRFQATLLIEGNVVAESTEDNVGGQTVTTLDVTGSAAVDTTGGVSVTMQLTRVAGTGTATVSATTPASTLHAILVPTV